MHVNKCIFSCTHCGQRDSDFKSSSGSILLLLKKKNEMKEQSNLRLYNYIAIYINCDYFPLRYPSRERSRGTRLENW